MVERLHGSVGEAIGKRQGLTPTVLNTDQSGNQFEPRTFNFFRLLANNFPYPMLSAQLKRPYHVLIVCSGGTG